MTVKSNKRKMLFFVFVCFLLQRDGKKKSKTSLGTDLLTFVGPTHGRGVEAPCGQCVEEDLLDRAEASLGAVDTTVHTFTNCNHDETFPWACSSVKHKTITLTAAVSEAVESTSMYM